MRIDLRIYKSRSMSRNQLRKFNMPSNAHNSANTKLPLKEMKFQELSNNMKKKWINIKFKMLKNIFCTLV